MMCPKCGKKTNDFIEGLCEPCYLKNHSLVKGFKDFEIFFCNCGKFKTKDKSKWLKCKSLNDAVNHAVNKNIVFEYGVIIEDVKTNLCLPKHVPNPGVKVVGEIELTVKGKFSDRQKKPVFEDTIIPVKVNFTICSDCSLEHSQYFEGKLQLRNGRPEIEEYITKSFADANGVHITKEKKVKNGVDYYVTSNTFLHSFGNDLKKRFGGEIKESSKLFSRNSTTSKELRRLTVLFKPFDFKKDDPVLHAGKVYKIVKMGKEVLGMNVVTEKTTLLKTDPEVPELLKSMKTTISRVRPRIEVIHPETYQSVKAENKTTMKKPGDEVNIVIVKDRFFIV